MVSLIRKADGLSCWGPGISGNKGYLSHERVFVPRQHQGRQHAPDEAIYSECVLTPQYMLDTVRSIFVAIVFFGSWLEAMRWRSGWKDFEPYETSPDAPNEKQISNGSYRWVSCQPKWTRFAVAVELYPQHLWLRPSFPFNLRLGAIYIPWDAINASQRKRFFSRTVTLRIHGCSTGLRFCGAVGQRILAEVETQRARSVAPNSVNRTEGCVGL